MNAHLPGTSSSTYKCPVCGGFTRKWHARGIPWTIYACVKCGWRSEGEHTDEGR